VTGFGLASPKLAGGREQARQMLKERIFTTSQTEEYARANPYPGHWSLRGGEGEGGMSCLGF